MNHYDKSSLEMTEYGSVDNVLIKLVDVTSYCEMETISDE